MENWFFTNIRFHRFKVVNINQREEVENIPTKKGLESKPFQNSLLVGLSLDRLALGWPSS